MTKPSLFHCDREEFQHVCRASVSFDPETKIATLLDGRLKMLLDERVDPNLTSCVVDDGFWEAWVTLPFGRRVEAGVARGPFNVLNIGANAGYYALLARSLGASVVAVEPQPSLCDLIDASASIVDGGVGIQTHCLAVWSSAADMMLAVAAPGSMNATIATGDAGHLVLKKTYCTTLRSLFGRIQHDYIFCDAEGAEADIFMGGAAVLQQHRPVVTLEFSPKRYADPEGFAEWWLGMEYDALVMDYDGQEKPIDLVGLARSGEERMITMEPKR